MNRWKAAGLGLAGPTSAVLASAVLCGAAPAPPAMTPTGGEKGYLAEKAIPDALAFLPPAPKPGSSRDDYDRSVFKDTRALVGTPRWSLAIADADLAQGPSYFSCALGLGLSPAKAPALTTLLRRMDVDVEAATDAPKSLNARPRPYTAADAANAPICLPRATGVAANTSYPSGHATIAWTWGMILAELAPDRAGQVLARARSIGESRVVCGVHYPSDIAAGRMTASAVVAALNADPAFRADLERARTELAALRAAPHAAPADCAVQDAAAAHAPF